MMYRQERARSNSELDACRMHAERDYQREAMTMLMIFFAATTLGETAKRPPPNAAAKWARCVFQFPWQERIGKSVSFFSRGSRLRLGTDTSYFTTSRRTSFDSKLYQSSDKRIYPATARIPPSAYIFGINHGEQLPQTLSLHTISRNTRS